MKDYQDSQAQYIFLHKDYIGSILAVSNQVGKRLEQRHYDAWGVFTHLKVGDGEILTDPEEIAKQNLILDRGYTSHEHFEEVGIIHMNGRLYDPLMRRFLNADENIQDMFNTQNYNKYGYVMNNPLMYNDPSGEFLGFIFGGMALIWKAVIIGAVVGLVSYSIGVAITGGKWNIGNAFKATFFGAVSGAATFGIGELFSVASEAGKLASFVNSLGGAKILVQGGMHAVSQGVLSVVQGQDFLSAAVAGFLGHMGAEAWGGLMGEMKLDKFANSTMGTIAFGALSGGIGAELTGGNFWQGAVTGGIVAGLNSVMHMGAHTLDNGITQDQQDDPEFFIRLKKRYESQKGGTFNLTKEEFLYLASKGKIDYQNATLIDAKNNVYKASINFYDSGFDLANAFGKATITYRVVNGQTLIRSFYDKYDFDPKAWGTRSTWSEIKTRVYNIYSSGKFFEIKYNQKYLRE